VGGNLREGDIYCVISNEVKQSHKSKFRLIHLPVRVRTQTGRFTPRNDNDEFNETGQYVYICILIYIIDKLYIYDVLY